ncbi:hypothetical protein NQ176_g963 [Zarea fungicola]|uniref:Uncharacterized protein n=1 Tax=Zarea fungicola TaxID=93591 RepID=A0ACC1NW87_9HYPO|nr:hypothetical protein NQ176_g963 [Lecanicillium fungicola]
MTNSDISQIKHALKETVIIFGPTGNVASVVARTAHAKGCNVVLAMRNIAKNVPGLIEGSESDFERIQADLKEPESVRATIEKSGAKRAFIYFINGTSDHMRSSIEALRTAGIELVVFLSTSSVLCNGRNIPPSDITTFLHAQVEIGLDEVFGPTGYLSLRPSRFTSTFTRYRRVINVGHVKLYEPDIEKDYITPTDIGRVGGSILAQGMRNGQNHVFLFGPSQISLRDAVVFIAKALGKPVQVSSLTAEEAVNDYMTKGLAKDIAEYVVSRAAIRPAGDLYKKHIDNVSLYTGSPPITFQKWVQENKAIFHL